MEMMMLCTHYITIAIVQILCCCILSFYTDTSVSLYRVLVDVILEHPFVLRLVLDVPVCKFVIYAFPVLNCVIYMLLFA